MSKYVYELKTIRTIKDLTGLVEDFGFLPFFENHIQGFSIEETTPHEVWEEYLGLGPWLQRDEIAAGKRCIYGKFFAKKTGYVSAGWFPHLANYRRDGYDFDARYDDGLASFHDKELYDLLSANAPILSKSLKEIGDYQKGGKKGFDTAITRLQKQCYVLTNDFVYATDRYGNAYGWGVAEYTTPEIFFGRTFRDKVYRRSPEESYERILIQFQKILPGTGKEEIERLLK